MSFPYVSLLSEWSGLWVWVSFILLMTCCILPSTDGGSEFLVLQARQGENQGWTLDFLSRNTACDDWSLWEMDLRIWLPGHCLCHCGFLLAGLLLLGTNNFPNTVCVTVAFLRAGLFAAGLHVAAKQKFMYIHIYIYMYTCIHVYIYIYIHISYVLSYNIIYIERESYRETTQTYIYIYIYT